MLVFYFVDYAVATGLLFISPTAEKIIESQVSGCTLFSCFDRITSATVHDFRSFMLARENSAYPRHHHSGTCMIELKSNMDANDTVYPVSD